MIIRGEIEPIKNPESLIVDVDALRGRKGSIAKTCALEALALGATAKGRFGLAYLVNTYIDPQEVNEFTQLFAKLGWQGLLDAVDGADLNQQRGFAKPNTEQAAAKKNPDYKINYFAVPEEHTDLTLESVLPGTYSPNRWPQGQDRFVELYKKLMGQLHELGCTILRALAIIVGLPQDTFVNLTKGGCSSGRSLSYGALTAEQVAAIRSNEEVLWGAEHTDVNLLTLIPEALFMDTQFSPVKKPDDGSGLILMKAGTTDWVAGKRPTEGAVLCQIGQTLDMLTGGMLQATPHAVLPPMEEGIMRSVFVFFMHPHGRHMIRPLDRFNTPKAFARTGVVRPAWALLEATLEKITLAPQGHIASLMAQRTTALREAGLSVPPEFLAIATQEINGNIPPGTLRDILIYPGDERLAS